MICVAALTILAIIALPSLLLKHPENRSEEEGTVPAEEDKEVESRVRYEDLLVREPIHPVEGAHPEFWLASSKQWFADQVHTQKTKASKQWLADQV